MAVDPTFPPAIAVQQEGENPPRADDLVSGVPALALAWDATGACTDGPAAFAGDGWLRALWREDRPKAAEVVRSALAGGAREEGVRLATGDRWAVLRVQAAPAGPGGGATGALVDVTRTLGNTARMARLVRGFNQLQRPEETVRTVLDEGLAALRARSASIYVLADGGDEMVVAGVAGLPEDEVVERFGRIPLDAPLPVTEVLRTGEVVTVRGHAERSARYPLLDELRITFNPAFVVVPLLGGDARPFGALAVGFPGAADLEAHAHDFLLDVAAQCALALDRARLAGVAERHRERLALLDELSASLSRDLDLRSTLTRLAETVVPRLADWCVVRMAGPAGAQNPIIGVAHVDPARREDLRRLAERIPRDLGRSGDVGEALTRGEGLVRRPAGDPMFGGVFDERDAEAISGVGADVVAVFPLTARGRLLGGLAFGNRAGRPMRTEDVDLAELVATRAATLVDNARLFHEQSGVARALQTSLLPGVLPAIPGIELGARYRAAGHGLDVGGDFYDAFAADDDWWIVAVGDVCGHGVEAAATTGLARHTIRASALAGTPPSAILGRLNEMLLRHSTELAAGDHGGVPPTPRFCTVVLGAVQPTAEGVDLVLCLGGHPPPLVRRVSGEVVPVGVPGTLLGVTPAVNLTDSVVHLDAGEALVCYTDGLSERRSGREAFGEAGVAAALAQGGGLGAAALAGLIEDRAVAYVDDEPTDDMAVLTLLACPPG